MAAETETRLFARRDHVGKLLLLKCSCTGMKGALALGRMTCSTDIWHIAIKTDNFQHPGCIDFRLSEGHTFERGNADPKKYSATYTVRGGPGTFHLYLRWLSGHSPYPEIRMMEAWAFGVYLGEKDYPKAGDDYLDIAEVNVDRNGFVTVNGLHAGHWPDLLLNQ